MTEKKKLYRILLYGFGATILLTILAGLYTSHKLIGPIKKLYNLVTKTNPSNLPTDFSKDFKDDEVGALSKALEDSMKRINHFIEREKQFTRDASHELRTPVTIIKGAVEILQNLPDEKKDKRERTIKRIERSVKDMETTIETFLWLGRESVLEDNKTLCDLSETVDSCVEDNRYLLHGKEVNVSVSSDENYKAELIEPVFKIAVTNLIRNAFNYTNTGSVDIRIYKNSITISDTGSGIESEVLEDIVKPHIKGNNSKGFGLGLSIVKQLCERCSWRFIIESSNEGTLAKLSF